MTRLAPSILTLPHPLAELNGTPHLPGYSYKLAEGYGLDVAFTDSLDIDEKKMAVWIAYADGNRRDGVGDLLVVEGIDDSRHRKNPIHLFDHGKSVTLPVGKVEDPETGRYTGIIDPVTKVAKDLVYYYQGTGLPGIDKSSEYDHALFCQQVFHLLAQKFIRGGSIGYQVKQARELPPEPMYGTPKGLHLLAVLKLESSTVVMPANADTVRKGLAPDLREVLSMPRVCGKPLSPMLVKSLTAYAPENTKTVSGYEGKTRGGSGGRRGVPPSRNDTVIQLGNGKWVVIRDGNENNRLTYEHDSREAAIKEAEGEGYQVQNKAQPGYEGKAKRGEGNPLIGFMQNVGGRGWMLRYTIKFPDGRTEERVDSFNTEEGARQGMPSITGTNARQAHARGGFVEYSNVRVEQRKDMPSEKTKAEASPDAATVNNRQPYAQAQAATSQTPKMGVRQKPDGYYVYDPTTGQDQFGPFFSQGIALRWAERLNMGKKNVKELRKKYRRTAKGLVRRLKRSSPGSSVVYLAGKDLEQARKEAEAKGIKFEHISSRNGTARVKLIGDDGAIDEVAKSYGRMIKYRGAKSMGMKSLELKPGDRATVPIGLNSRTEVVVEKVERMGNRAMVFFRVINTRTGKPSDKVQSRWEEDFSSKSLKSLKSLKALDWTGPGEEGPHTAKGSKNTYELRFDKDSRKWVLYVNGTAKGKGNRYMMSSIAEGMETEGKSIKAAPLRKPSRTNVHAGDVNAGEYGGVVIARRAIMDKTGREYFAQPGDRLTIVGTDAGQMRVRNRAGVEQGVTSNDVRRKAMKTKAVDSARFVGVFEQPGQGFYVKVSFNERKIKELLKGPFKTREEAEKVAEELARTYGIPLMKNLKGIKSMKNTKKKDGEELSDTTASGEERQLPLGAQVLRRLHEDASLLLQDYDEMLGPLENESVKSRLQAKAEAFAEELAELEEEYGKLYPDLGGLVGTKEGELEDAADLESDGEPDNSKEEFEDELEATPKDMDTMDDDAVGGSSEEREEVSPEDALEGMEQADEEEGEKSLRNGRKVKSLRRKYGKAMPEEDLAYRQGYKAGEARKPKQNPYQHGDRRFEAWEDGYKDGKDGYPSQVKSKKGLCPECQKEDCECGATGEKVAPALVAAVAPAVGQLVGQALTPKDKGYVKEAGGFLGEVGQPDSMWDDESRMKSYHYHKTLSGMVQMGEANEELNEGEVEGDIPPAEFEPGVGAKSSKPEHRRSDTNADGEVRGERNEVSRQVTNPAPDPEPGQAAEVSMKTGPLEVLQGAGDFLKELSLATALEDTHRESALGHSKALNDFAGSDEEEPMEEGDPEGVVMEEEPGMEMKFLADEADLQNKKIAELSRMLSRLPI